MVKPAEDPSVLAPEPAMPTSPPRTEAPEDPTVDTQIDPPELSADDTIVNPSTAKPSSSANPPSSSDHDILVTGSRYVEPGTPTMLARHIAKQEALER